MACLVNESNQPEVLHENFPVAAESRLADKEVITKIRFIKTKRYRLIAIYLLSILASSMMTSKK